MKSNKLQIRINKPVADVFTFTITPPNSTKWIPGVVWESTYERPVNIDTIYKLQMSSGENYEVIVTDIKTNEFIEWRSKDGNYHCKYAFKPIDENTTDLEYFEWVGLGDIDSPFTQSVLDKLKSVLES